MEINVQDNLIELKNRDTITIDNEMESFLETNEGENIKSDIESLVQMGFDKKIINKVYIILKPPNIDRAIDYMSEIDGIYQHNFIESTNPKEKLLCFICKKPKQNHLDYIPDDLLNENQNIDIIDNQEENIIDYVPQNNDKDKDSFNECDVCYDEINEEDKKLNTIPCGHLFCTHCWFNYLKTSIIEAKVENIKCMEHECKDIISEEFILKHLKDNNDLIEKYNKFKKRAEIINDKNKKQCPHPNCESFLQKSEKSKYVKCENGHKYCFECLKPSHGDKSCDYQIEKQFANWTKGKRVKRCPRCKMYTEKNEGCNHMTCVNCKYQWCWLCEGQYIYGHYDSGKCKGHQFTKADNIKDLRKHRCGLFRLFPCVCNEMNVCPPDSCCLTYLFILLYCIIGFGAIFVFTFVEFYDFRMKQMKSDIKESVFMVFIYGTGICLFVSFQIQFLCLITPFILVSVLYRHFFYLFIHFLGIGDSII